MGTDQEIVDGVAWCLHHALVCAGEGNMRLSGIYWNAALHASGKIHSGDIHSRAQHLVISARTYIEGTALHMLSVLALFWNGNPTRFHTLGRVVG